MAHIKLRFWSPTLGAKTDLYKLKTIDAESRFYNIFLYNYWFWAYDILHLDFLGYFWSVGSHINTDKKKSKYSTQIPWVSYHICFLGTHKNLVRWNIRNNAEKCFASARINFPGSKIWMEIRELLLSLK